MTVKRDGFRTAVRDGIELTVGRDAALDIELVLGAMTSETVVTADADPVETRATGLSAAMSTSAIRDLPLNGRDFAQLALLEPGVAPSRRTSDSGGPGTKLVMGGNRPSQVSFLLDGSDINDANNNTPGGAAGVMLGVDTLREFRVLTNGYSAAYGRSGGGVVSAVTKSGGNDLHGSVFEFIRNSAWMRRISSTPRPPLSPPSAATSSAPPSPVPSDMTRRSFSPATKVLRQRLGVTSRSVVPDAAARAPRTSSVTPYLNLIPLPNDRSFGDGTGEFVSTASQATGENFFTGRIDHRLSDRTSLFARYTFDGATVAVPDGLRLVRADNRSRNQFLTGEITRLFSERTLDTLRVSYNRSNSATANTFLRTVDPSLSFLPGQPLGQISVTGLFSLGPSRFGPQFSTMNLFQATNEYSRTAGSHTIRAGGDYRFYHLPTSRPQSPYGFYQFNSLSAFLQAQPASVELTLPESQLERHWSQSMAAAYVEDSVRFRRVTLNLGLRYERVSVPSESQGLLANLRDPLHDAKPTVGALYVNPSNRNFAPRVGVAWDPFGDGRTSVRSGFGVFYDPVWTDFYANAGNRLPPFYTLGSIRNPVFPRADELLNSPAFVLGRLDVLQYRPQNPYTLQYNFALERQVARSTVLTLAYAGQRGVHIVRFIDGNQAIPQILPDGRKFFPADSVTRNPNLTGVRYKATDGQSVYNALRASLDHRFRHGLQVQVHYTFARNIDDGSVTVTQGGDNDLPQDPDSRKAERGLSNYDVRHYVAAYWTWSLGKGWQWNTIVAAASGNPFSVVVGFDRARARFQAGTSPQRPDLVAGRTNDPVLGGPDRYFDPAAFALPDPGFYGNLGRNTLTGPGMINADTSLTKTLRLTEAVSLQVRAEAFNIFNHPNFAIPTQRTVFSATGPVGSAGRITSTATPPRQLQLGLKLTF